MPDLYRLTAEQLMELDGYGEISARNAIAAIEASRMTMPFRRVLFGLNIPDVGWVTAQNLARHFGTRRPPASPRRPRSSSSARASAPSAPRRSPSGSPTTTTGALVAELRGARPRASRPTRATGRKEGPLTGRQYVITGTLEGFTREEAKAALEALGAKVSDSVSKKTTGVIVGESPGSKAAKAEAAGVPILGEDDLRALLESR